ncbi:hypothetical protein CEXT_333071 [Caerostris extrusa]|uniref:Uncharacterized protein n=1 Tax=Caerostris extrusa TaxID=172846 RepID=A0AAV4VGH3_CAEEX|nr:hypothetical protein CEXT_333071 [Caerostris extrusa]
MTGWCSTLQRRKLHHKENSSGPASSWARGQSSTPVPQVVRLGEKKENISFCIIPVVLSVNDLAVPFSSLVRLFNRSGGRDLWPSGVPAFLCPFNGLFITRFRRVFMCGLATCAN